MKSYFIILYCLISAIGFSQKKVIKKFETQVKTIEISTLGLDELVIENSNSGFVEVILYAENPNEQHILIDKNKYETTIKFKLPILVEKEVIFRKFITERLQRAAVTIKIPKNKNVSVFGESINVESKSYQGNLRVFIENGIVKLDTVQQNLELKLFSGNVFATIKNTSLKVVSNLGKIKIDSILVSKKYSKKEVKSKKEVNINSLKANIFLTTQ